MTTKAGNSSIKIPVFNAPANLDVGSPPAGVIGAGDPFAHPDAPMSDSGKAAPKAPPVNAQPQGTEDFLKSVREMNEAKVPEAEREKKKDPTPDPQDSQDNSDDANASDDVDDGFVDPADAPPVKKDKATSFKEIKQQLTTTRTKLTTTETKLAELEAENERLLSLQDKASQVEEMQQRIKELEPFEQIVDIHNNPQFHDKYIRGDQARVENAVNIAKHYNSQVTAQTIEKAVGIENRKELNDFLRATLKDDIGVGEVRQHILDVQALRAERGQLEKSPAEAKEVLSRMYRDSEERRTTEVTKQIKDRGDSAWGQLSNYYSKGDNALDLFKEKPADAEHSQIRSEILTRSNVEYQKVLGALVGLGAKELPVALAQTLAARFQLSEAAGELNALTKVQAQQIKDLKKTIQEMDKHNRPNFNGSNGSSNQDTANGEIPSGGVAEHVFNKARTTILNQEAQRR